MANTKFKRKNRKGVSALQLALILLVIVVASYLALNGFGRGTMVRYMLPWGEAISLGLDLRGGVYTVYQADSEGVDDFDAKMDSTVSILTSRLTRQGFTEATITRQMPYPLEQVQAGDTVIVEIVERNLANLLKYPPNFGNQTQTDSVE